MIIIVALFSFYPVLFYGQQTSSIDSLEQMLETVHEDTNRVKTINKLVSELKVKGDFLKAIGYEKEALSLAVKLNYKTGAAVSMKNLGILYSSVGNFQPALENLSSALRAYQEIGDKSGMADCYNNTGIIYSRQGNLADAMNMYIEALRIHEELGNKKGIGSTYNNIGIIHKQQRNYPEALKNHLAAFEIRKEIGDKVGMSDSYSNIGNIYFLLGNPPDALKNHMASLEIAEEAGDKQRIANSYNNIGRVYSGQSDYSEALNYYIKSLKIREDIGDRYGMVTSYNNIAETFVLQASLENGADAGLKYAEAFRYSENGLQLAREIGFKEGMRDSYTIMLVADTAQGNYEQALQHYMSFTLYKDSLVNEASNKQVSQMKIQYETEKKDKEIELLSKDNRIKALQMEKQKVSLLASAIKLENNKLQLEKTKKDLDHQRLETKAKKDEVMLVTKENALKEQKIVKQKLLRNTQLIGMAVLILLGFLLFRGWKLRKKLEKQSAIIQERKRISADLHDDIGSGLSKISLLSEMVKQQAATTEARTEAEKIATTSRELLDSIREIIWALNSNNDYIENLVSYIRRYAAEYFENSKVKLTIDAPEKILHVPISGENRRNIFFSVKEAMHNIVKHAGASEAELKFSFDDGLFSVSIKDNGKGFPEGELNRFGNGLKNIISRMKSIHGNVLIENHVGTKITLALPVSI